MGSRRCVSRVTQQRSPSVAGIGRCAARPSPLRRFPATGSLTAAIPSNREPHRGDSQQAVAGIGRCAGRGCRNRAPCGSAIPTAAIPSKPLLALGAVRGGVAGIPRSAARVVGFGRCAGGFANRPRFRTDDHAPTRTPSDDHAATQHTIHLPRARQADPPNQRPAPLLCKHPAAQRACHSP